MRILIVDANLRYVNPMRNLLPYYMAKAGDDVTFYGPGYSTTEELEAGLSAFASAHGPFDIDIRTVHGVTSNIMDEISSNFSATKLAFYKASYSYSFSDNDLRPFWQDTSLCDHFGETSVIMLHQFDFQVMTEEFKNHVLDSYDLIVGLNQDFWERHDYKSLNLSKTYKHTDCWSELLEVAKTKIVGIPNFVAPSEFDFNIHSNRKFDWSVMGTTYPNRGKVKKAFSKNSVNYTSGRTSRYMVHVLKHKLGLNPHNNRRTLDKVNANFHYSLINSRYSYTCGSDLRMPIRKFFEIPAAGCTLVCTPCIGFESLGFRNNVNAIACSPEEVLDVNQRLQSDPVQAQKIAQAGQQLVLEKHSINVRSEQLRKSIRLAHQKKYFGSTWLSGDLSFS
jgi:hypothetical protein